MKQIRVIVRPDGTTEVVAEGFTGRSCRQATRFLREALGQCVRERLTREFYLTQENRQVREGH